MKSLTEIKEEVDRLAEIIGATEHRSLPTYGYTRDAGYSHVEIDLRGYHLVTVEHGEELERFTTNDLDDLLYHIFADVTRDLADSYELTHRIERQDNRRILFWKQVELLSRLSAGWAQRQANEQEQILRESPFDDYSNIRVTLTKELRYAGNASETAWQMACERYPLPAVQKEFGPALEQEQNRLSKTNDEPDRQPSRTIPAPRRLPMPPARSARVKSPPGRTSTWQWETAQMRPNLAGESFKA
jgi:hypothetical protein